MATNNSIIRDINVRPVLVPMRRPILTGGGALEACPLVLVDMQTTEGLTGSTYVFCYSPLILKPMVSLLNGLGTMLSGEPVVPHVLSEKLQRTFRLLGPQGLVTMAVAAIDMAAWDLCAKAAGMPLVKLLGGDSQPIPAYNSNGLGIMDVNRVRKEAQDLVNAGFYAIKVRLGYPDARTDVEIVRAIRQAVPNNIRLMSDYNQALSVPEAIQRVAALDQEGLYWIEEPIRADNYAGYAQIKQTCTTPIQLGENFWGTHDMGKAIAAKSGDFLMPDVNKIGGVSGWVEAASLCRAYDIPLSSHLYPEVSAHLLAASSRRHWLEYVDWAEPILEEPVRVEDGHILPSVEPGTGIAWNETAVNRHLV